MCLQSMSGARRASGDRYHAVSDRRLARGGASSQRSSARTSLRSAVLLTACCTAIPRMPHQRRDQPALAATWEIIRGANPPRPSDEGLAQSGLKLPFLRCHLLLVCRTSENVVYKGLPVRAADSHWHGQFRCGGSVRRRNMRRGGCGRNAAAREIAVFRPCGVRGDERRTWGLQGGCACVLATVTAILSVPLLIAKRHSAPQRSRDSLRSYLPQQLRD